MITTKPFIRKYRNNFSSPQPPNVAVENLNLIPITLQIVCRFFIEDLGFPWNSEISVQYFLLQYYFLLNIFENSIYSNIKFTMDFLQNLLLAIWVYLQFVKIPQ